MFNFLKPKVITEYVYVDRPIEVIKEVPDPTTEAALTEAQVSLESLKALYAQNRDAFEALQKEHVEIQKQIESERMQNKLQLDINKRMVSDLQQTQGFLAHLRQEYSILSEKLTKTTERFTEKKQQNTTLHTENKRMLDLSNELKAENGHLKAIIGTMKAEIKTLEKHLYDERHPTH